MILARLSRAIRDQNWFAVALEFVIVIAGVVIGFQIQGWAQDRAVSARENQYLYELLADMRGMIQYMEQINEHTSYQTDLGAAVEVLQSCPADEAEWSRVRQTLATHRLRTAAFVIDGTYEEMVASGALARLEDAELKAQIKRSYALLNNNQRQAQAGNQRLAYDASRVIVNTVPFAPDPEAVFGVMVEPDFDLRELCENIRFQNALLDLQHAHLSRIRLNTGFLEVLRETETMLVTRTEESL